MPSKATPARSGVASLESWGELGIHMVTCPSGALVRIRIPDLSLLLASDSVPGELRQIAMLQISKAIADGGDADVGKMQMPKIDEELIGRLADLHEYLISEMLVEPKVTVDQVASIPSEDRDMLTQIAGRQRNVDARGISIGIEPIDRWEVWRDTHSCPDDCDHCAEVVGALSSIGRVLAAS